MPNITVYDLSNTSMLEYNKKKKGRNSSITLKSDNIPPEVMILSITNDQSPFFSDTTYVDVIKLSTLPLVFYISFDIYPARYNNLYTSLSLSLSLYVCVCVCVCVN